MLLLKQLLLQSSAPVRENGMFYQGYQLMAMFHERGLQQIGSCISNEACTIAFGSVSVMLVLAFMAIWRAYWSHRRREQSRKRKQNVTGFRFRTDVS